MRPESKPGNSQPTLNRGPDEGRTSGGMPGWISAALKYAQPDEPAADAVRITSEGQGQAPSAMSDAGIQTRWIKRPGSVWRLIAGWGCIGAGLLGLILPVIPGIPLLIFGLVMLSTQYHWAHKAVLWMKARFRKHKPDQ